ncbi:sigma-54 dependent transcriptional regulator [Planctomicrobium piriforme]|uniref:DNA-binding transcriptional response regulator, NtrC family, contains REC, AAA-type ATPase, and a Fis-type DNA-binding domains n=1 Tax=Planctomicrobium piriforme TaxID=1576369 RepID=A0A1I3LLZ6_9PLAN|nr:sigma-54 dependent transcriptional regulator [Planctomicrobium piriforme]SFI85809.1 DNA-binding transcriptional response regulator, NtrC family, contains REC, AAA-type ATPase, and a Fis-type DNA-binding domains [Planctomicrobium piriforme]
MQTPTVIIATADERLGRDLAGSLAGSHQLSVTTQIEQVRFLLSAPGPDLLLLDVRFTTDNGRAASELLTAMTASHPQTCVIALVSAQSHLAVNLPEHPSLTPYHGAVSAVEVRALISRTLAAKAAAAPAPVDPTPAPQPAPASAQPRDAGPNSFGAAVFEGVTRQFETRSHELKKMLDDLMIAASHDVTILLIGETGSGKTFLSNLVHESSPRKDEPFLHIACGALPRDLLESELFGHVKGAFTSAHADKEGKFLAARRGTILLDEIDVLGPEQQVKLLRVIETGEFEPVGSNQTYRSQARLVVASNLELQPLVEQGKFRPDLYYRLNMLKFELPPLRKRKADIIPLAKKFISHFQQKHSIQIHRIDDSMLDELLTYPWPGNVRELEHVIQRAVIYCRNGVLSREHLPAHLLSGHAGPTNDASVHLGASGLTTQHSLERQVAVSEKEIIEQALFKNNFSRTRTAVDLGISRVTLYNKMKKYEMLK